MLTFDTTATGPKHLRAVIPQTADEEPTKNRRWPDFLARQSANAESQSPHNAGKTDSKKRAALAGMSTVLARLYRAHRPVPINAHSSCHAADCRVRRQLCAGSCQPAELDYGDMNTAGPCIHLAQPKADLDNSSAHPRVVSVCSRPISLSDTGTDHRCARCTSHDVHNRSSMLLLPHCEPDECNQSTTGTVNATCSRQTCRAAPRAAVCGSGAGGIPLPLPPRHGC